LGFIVRSIGSHENVKFFESRAEAMRHAHNGAEGEVECMLVYRWSGDLTEGIAEANAGRLTEIAHVPHREAPREAPPEPPIRLPKETDDYVAELVKKLPRIARKF
jgi:hypothetical protein